MGARPEPLNLSDSGLTARDVAMLDFEREQWRHAGTKEDAIRSQFALPAARYYQLLNAVIDLPAAERHDPMLVRRLQRARDERTATRAARAFRRIDHHG